MENSNLSYFGLRDIDSFKKSFIDQQRGNHLFLVRFEQIQGLDLLDFVQRVREYVFQHLQMKEVEFGFHIEDKNQCLLMGLSSGLEKQQLPNIDKAIGIYHDDCLKKKVCNFNFGVARTQCNYVSDIDEIFDGLNFSSLRNLQDNLVRWSWTYFNLVNAYFSTKAHDAVIQPTLKFDPKRRTFSVCGGEVFVGGDIFRSYEDLIDHIPPDQNRNRIELLILEKLILASEGAPGLLKFNISPQSLIDTFAQHEKVQRFMQLINRVGLDPARVRFELIEKPYEERGVKLLDVCRNFWQGGIGFAADDFGVKSQSHQVVLDLGVMIKEFKLDPISFKFKAEEDYTKFLDNLAFIDYCKRLADNREAGITAEAVEDFDTLRFLLEHQIYQFQAFIFCRKMPMEKYIARYSHMQNLPEDTLRQVLASEELSAMLAKTGSIFDVAEYLAGK